MAAHLGKIKAPVMIGVGAAFDIHAGLVLQAPRWMQRFGLEWLFRLLIEPDGSGVVTWSTTRSSSRSSCCN